jgi:hypothetical protein
MSAKFQLAQVNIGRLRAPIDHPMIKDFADNLDPINALAEASPGFVWRLTDHDGHDATSMRPFPDHDVINNLSVWESVEDLEQYVYRGRHLDPLRRRREWFLPNTTPNTVLWWIPAGTVPTVAEAMERLATLTRSGPGPEAFTFRQRHEAPIEGASFMP